MAVKVGVIGLGALGSLHFKNLLSMEQVEVVAICDVRPERMAPDKVDAAFNIAQAQTKPLQLGNIRKYDDYKKLLRQKDIQAVAIATPTFLHPEMTVKALKAGKHVFSEKPMGLSLRDAQKMTQAAKQAGKILQVGHVLRFWPEYVLLKEMIDAKPYGAIRSATFTRLGGFPLWAWENWFLDPSRSGGAAIDLHIHDVDVINWFFGAPTRVSSTGMVEPDGAVNHISTQYFYPNIPMVTAQGGWLTGPFPFHMAATIEFDTATAIYDSRNKETLGVYHKALDQSDNRVDHPAVPAGSGYAIEMDYFISCIAGGRPNERIPAEQTAQAVALVAAEIKSVKTGKPVAIKG